MISVLDISSVTDRLVDYLTDSVAAWPGWVDNGGPITKFDVSVTGQMPETVRNKTGCQLTLYLFHVNPEPFTRNMPLTGPRPQTNPSQALGLDLHYLLTAFAKDSSIQEQQAMSIALKALHERATYVDPIDNFTFTITMDSEKPDEANRRWQSYSTPFRLSAAYTVAVVFLTPKSQPPAPAPPPRRIGLSSGPASLPFARAGALTATASRVDLLPLNPQPTDTIVYDYTPAVTAPGGRFVVFGTGLDQPTSQRLYLIDALLVETEISAWRVGVPGPSFFAADVAAGTAPGIYQIRVGSSTAAGDAADYRSNSVPLLICAAASPVPAPWTPAGGLFSFSGAGFADGATEVTLDTISLAALPLGSAPGLGEFAINAALNQIDFKPPANTPAGKYYVRIRVRGVEGPAVGWIMLP